MIIAIHSGNENALLYSRNDFFGGLDGIDHMKKSMLRYVEDID